MAGAGEKRCTGPCGQVKPRAPERAQEADLTEVKRAS